MRAEQTVDEMAEEVLKRQAKAMVAQTGELFESALEAVACTEAGQQLRELANGEHRQEKAQDWQVSVLWERTEERLMHLGALPEHTHLPILSLLLAMLTVCQLPKLLAASVQAT